MIREHVTVDLDAKDRSDDNSIVFPLEGLTKQAHADECDISRIMARFDKTGLIDHVNKFNGDYGDFSDAQSYHDSLNAVIAADDMFMSLPAQIRVRFENDPARFLEFVSDPSNASEMVSLGLAHPPEEVVEAVSEPSDSES